MKDPLIAIGTCKIVAAAAPAEGEAPKLPAVDIEAYDGGIMSVSYYGPVVIDLEGLQASDLVPILFAHGRDGIDDILGQTSKVLNDKKTLSMTGQIMASTSTVEKVTELSGNGFAFQASVGLDPLQTSDVAEGATVTANGKELTGPFTLVAQSILKEISILPLGAGDRTSAKIAAEQARKKEPPMKTKEPAEKTAEEIRAGAVAEETRITGVREVAKDHPEIMATAIEKGQAPAEVRTLVLEAQLAAEIKRNERPATPAIVGTAGKEVTTEILAAAVSMRAGLQNADKVFSAEICQKGAELKLHSFTDLIRAGLAASGKALEFTRHETREFLQAAFSTADIANVIAATANKFILEGYGTVEEAWRKVSVSRPVVDFKANTGVRLVLANLLKELGNGGEIEHGNISDDTRTVQADTKALMLAVTRKDIINDDLGVLSDLPRRLGFAAARTFNTDFWATFEAAVAAAFTGGHANTTTGALTSATMTAAETLFDALSDNDGNPLGTEASMILSGSTASAPARELFISQNMIGGTSKTPGSNIYAGVFEPVKSRYLSAAPWLMVGNPLGVPLMEASFLNGREEPFVETADADFNTLGIQMRCYYDYGTDFAEWRAAVYSTGV